MMNILIIRHGETDWNVENRCQGWRNIPLNANGKSQTVDTLKAIRNIHISKIYSSPLIRAYEMAYKISKVKKVPLFVIDDLKEVNFGIWEGKKIDFIKQKFQSLYHIWVTQPEKICFPNGENLKAFSQRVIKSFNKIVNENLKINNDKKLFSKINNNSLEKTKILIISHGMVNRIILCKILGLSIGQFRYLSNDNASISEIEVNSEGKLSLKRINDTCHLKKQKKY